MNSAFDHHPGRNLSGQEMQMLGKVIGAVLLIVALGLSGCGRKGPIMVPISGTVTLDGKPMPDGIIYFKTIVEGSVDQMDIKDGKFAGKVEVGDRRVEVCRYGLGPPIKMGNAEIPNKIETLPARYNQASELKASVTQRGANEFSFEVKSK
jgi:putative lipoprotein